MSGASPNDVNVRPLKTAASVLLASGIVHLIVLAFDQSAWEGPLSWRKPILFGISTGLTVWSLGQAWLRIRPRRVDSFLIPLTAIASLIEVGLITLQTWRRVPSHFNHSTTLDKYIHVTMDVCIVILTVVIFDLTLRLFQQRNRTNPMTFAYRQGMLMLSISCVIGFAILGIGFVRQHQGLDPSHYGMAGVPKFAHGAVIHALQWLPAIAFALSVGRFNERDQRKLIWSASLGSWGLLAYAVLQTFSGRSRFDVTILSGNLLAVSLVLIVIPVTVALFSTAKALFRKHHQHCL